MDLIQENPGTQTTDDRSECQCANKPADAAPCILWVPVADDGEFQGENAMRGA